MNNPNNQEFRENKQQPEPQSTEPESLQLVHKHMADEHHEITDEELRNVRISTDHIHLDDTPSPQKDTNGNQEDEKDPNHPIVTPWDLTT